MNYNFYYTLLLPVSIACAMTSCKKERTLDADLTVRSAKDGSAIPGATIIYEYKGQASAELVKEEVGTTDENGKFHFSRKVARFDTYTRLRIHAEGYENAYTYGFEVYIEPGKDNTIEKQLNPCYHFAFSLKNLNCFNETDTVWVNNLYDYQPNSLIFTGCVDTILKFFEYPYTGWTYYDNKTINLTVKRNGVVTSFEQQTPMVLKQIVPISIVL